MLGRRPLTAEFDATVLEAELPRRLLAGHMRYRNLSLLARGGKAEVFRCQDAILGREIALKVLHRTLAESPVEQQLLIREARILAALRHPGVPEVYDLSRDPDGRPYFAMSLKTGPTLHEVLWGIRGGNEAVLRTYNLERLLSLLLQVANTLEYAHGLNVVHCDLKPENIILDATGTAFLIDWGLAIVDDYAPEARVNPAVQARGRQGTALYMSPEQAAGDHRLTAAVDVYGLGVLLYECLTLQTPHCGSTKHETLRQVLEREPPLPRDAAPARMIPRELQDVCLRALRKAPEQRYDSVTEFREALEDVRTELLLQVERGPFDERKFSTPLGGWNEAFDADRATERFAAALR